MHSKNLPAPIEMNPPRVPAIGNQALIDAWLDGRQASTVEGYRRDLNHFGRFLAAHITGSLDPLSTHEAFELFLSLAPGSANAAVLAYRADQLGAGLASATISRRIAAVKSIVKIARTLGRIDWSIEVEAPRHEDRRDMSGPNDSERKKLVKYLKARGTSAEAIRDRALYALLFTMALRRAELLGLDLADVDFAAGTLSIRRKGNRESTARPMPPNAARALGEWVVSRGRHEGPLFSRCDRKSSTRLTGEALRLILGRVGKEAGLTKSIRPHGLRHAGITKLRSLGETDRNVMALSGHKDPKMLARYDDTKREGAVKMSRKLDSELG